MFQKRKDPIRVRAKRAHVSEAKDGLDPLLSDVFEGGFQSKIVVVDPPENGNPPIFYAFTAHASPLAVQSRGLRVEG
jgi:hypothetical protein